MQNEFDNILKDKLSGYAADFNSADWQKMEAMLPKQSRKPYALIALLFLSFGIAGLFFGTGEFNQENYSAVIESTNAFEKNAMAELSTNSKAEKGDKNEAGTETDIQKQKVKQPQSVLNTNTNESGTSKSSDNVGTPSPLGEGRSVLRSFSKGGGEVVTKREGSSNEKENLLSNDSDKSSLVKNSSSNSYEENTHQSYSGSIESTTESSAEIQNNTETISALASIESGFINLSNDEKTLAEKSALSDDATPKNKPQRKIVTFALGAGAGINFSFIDAARWTKPGYTVDIAQELMFIHRIGIALTQGYTERKYDGGQLPCPTGTLDCPYSYNSTVRSVDFSVALKANLIHKTKWNWYVKGGVINTVKLKEEFSYNYPQTDTISPPTLPPQTNFNGSGFPTSESMSDPNLGLDAASAPSDLSVSGAKRYHIAFLSATGFDVTLKPNLNVQVEANHSFTQPTVGADNKRMHTIGINARCLYLFGR